MPILNLANTPTPSGAAGLPRNRWPVCVGITGWLQSECPAALRRNAQPLHQNAQLTIKRRDRGCAGRGDRAGQRRHCQASGHGCQAEPHRGSAGGCGMGLGSLRHVPTSVLMVRPAGVLQHLVRPFKFGKKLNLGHNASRLIAPQAESKRFVRKLDFTTSMSRCPRSDWLESSPIGGRGTGIADDSDRFREE